MVTPAPYHSLSYSGCSMFIFTVLFCAAACRRCQCQAHLIELKKSTVVNTLMEGDQTEKLKIKIKMEKAGENYCYILCVHAVVVILNYLFSPVCQSIWSKCYSTKCFFKKKHKIEVSCSILLGYSILCYISYILPFIWAILLRCCKYSAIP